jgi:sugar lactone lactonase YvrE
VAVTRWSVLPGPRCELGESPVWRDGRLFYVDIRGQALHAVEDGSVSTVELARPVTAIVPTSAGGWIAVSGRELSILDAPTGRLDPLIAVPGPPELALNDAVAGRDGNLYVGSVDRSGGSRAELYAIGPGLDISVVATGVGASNGLDTSADGSVLWHADTFKGTVTAYPCGTVIDVPRPDGLTVDASGCVWVALWGSGQVRRYRPGGACDRRYRAPAPLVTNVALGGGRLLVTTARSGGHPFSGAVLSRTVECQGLPAAEFSPR